MAAFLEPLLQEQLWYWLETEKDMTVDGEVKLSTGRIDLAAETPDGKYIGIEVKRGSGLEFGSELYEQVHRYIESGVFDELYFASRSVDPIINELENNQSPNVSTLNQASKQIRAAVGSSSTTIEEAKSRIQEEVPERLLKSTKPGQMGSVKSYVFDKLKRDVGDESTEATISEGVRYLRRAECPTELGVIHVPLNLHEVLQDLERVHEPERAYEPIVRRDAEQLDRTDTPNFRRREESWIRHSVWEKYGGLPEGYLPNVRSSDQSYRPIDLMSFSGGYDPTEILDSGEGKVVGVEAKGESSFDKERLSRQLSEFLTTKSLTHLYLAVPTTLRTKAVQILDDHKDGEDIGLITVDERGDLTTIRDAPRLDFRHDGYMSRYSPQKIGYGDVAIADGREVISPFLTTEEKERIKYSDATERALDLLKDNSKLANNDGWIENEKPTDLYPTEDTFNKEGTARAYLLKGMSAAPYYAGDQPAGSTVSPKEGYVRLSLTEYEVDDEFALKLHFGQGSWEGGYISIVGDQVQTLIDILASFETIQGGSVPGQGKYIDLESFPFDRDQNEPHRVSGGSGEVEPLFLEIEMLQNEPDTAARLQLGDGEDQGVDVVLTKIQLFDLLASIAILREGNRRQLPGEYSSYPRIGPSGENTWDIGRDIEQRTNPDPPEEW